MKKIPIIILASARKNSDTRAYVERVFTGTEYKLIDLLDYTVLPYDYGNQYSQDDDFLNIIDEILQYNVIVFATPVYWYSMSGLMKTFFDRFTDIVTIKKQLGRQLKDKFTFLMAVGTDKDFPVGFEKPFELTSRYLHMSYQGHIYYSTKYSVRDEMMEDLNKAFIQKIKYHSEQTTGP